jgi:predicted DNA-binding transcriptional regulator YafY
VSAAGSGPPGVEPGWGEGDEERGGKRDRLARFYRVLRVLEARGEQGARIEEIARLVGMSRRTVYRDLKALEGELGIPLWSDGGRWGVEGKGFLPPLKLTRAEAMAVFLSARLMVRYADEYDADLAAAFQKMADGLPSVLADHVARTLEVMSRRQVDPSFTRHVQVLTQAWAERRVVTFVYDASAHDPARGSRDARVHPWYIEPSLSTHALYLFGWDEARSAPRTFKIDRIRDLALTAATFQPPSDSVEDAFTNAWDIIADQPVVSVVLRFDPAIAARVQEATWHPSQVVEREADGSLIWRGRVSGTIEIRLWILSWGQQVEVLAPAELRADVAATYREAAARYADDRARGT